MKANKRIVIWLIALCVVLFTGLTVQTYQAQAAEALVLRVTDLYPEKHPIGQGFLKYFAEPLEKRSGGRIKVDYYGQQTLVKARDMFDATVSGTADIGNMVYAGSKVPLIYFQQLPGVYSDDESVRSAKAFWQVSKKYIAPLFEEKGLKLLYGFTTSGYQLITSKKAVRTIDDFKGLKVRSAGAVLPKSVKALGGVPVSISIGEAYEALERRVIDGISIAVPSVKSYSFYELIKYATINADLGGYPVYYAMNLKTWNKLPDDIRKMIVDMSDNVTSQTTEFYVKRVHQDMQEWKEKGIELIKLSSAENKKKAKMLSSVWAEWINGMDAKGFPIKDLILDWEKALAAEGLELDPALLEQLPWK
jgi:TRAP-type C4-dicarboxylate transport system substrate-binding protein